MSFKRILGCGYKMWRLIHHFSLSKLILTPKECGTRFNSMGRPTGIVILGYACGDRPRRSRWYFDIHPDGVIG